MVLISQIRFLITWIAIGLIKADFYSAIVEMEELLETEEVLIKNLQRYIEAQEAKIQDLKQDLTKYQKENTEAVADSSLYLSNPINAYLLTKRLTIDWIDIENYISFDVGSDFQKNNIDYRNKLKFPTDRDLKGAAVALVRLQTTYNLSTESIAKGELNGVQYGIEMTSSDCFEIGRQLVINKDHHNAVPWLNEALGRLTKEGETSFTFRIEILDYLAFSKYMLGNVKMALQITNQILELSPTNVVALEKKTFYANEISARALNGHNGSDELRPTTTEEKILFEKVCRGEVQPTPKQLRPLRCRYIDNNIPYLKIAPFKIEEFSISPYIIVYHEVINDHEIEVVKQMAKPRFELSAIKTNPETGEQETADYRVSKVAWLDDVDHKVIKNIARRVQDMTGLSIKTAEELQVLNYGIGGHYEAHFDWAQEEDKPILEILGTGDRIATTLFYMSDVEQGGATAFHLIRTAVWPKKGTAAFWYNLHLSGDGDYRVRHAACPVLKGTKWVANKWLQEFGQEFIRPCALQRK